jgi:tetratricopeptide (TPR) repeat protein
MRSWRNALVAFTLVVTAVAMPIAGVSAQPQAPFAGGAGGGTTPSPKTAKLQKKAEQLAAQYKKKPNAKLKMETAQAWYDYGHARMYDNALSARNKYRPALTAFREALKLNPNHKQAKADKEMIENIYRQMGMPVPQ